MAQTKYLIFCLSNKIKLIYSATSASLGNNGEDKNLSPYAFTKAKNLHMLENLKKWFNLKFEIVYFYNVYGPNQISKGYMATVIGIFEEQFKKGEPLTIVKPGTQTRRFTHISDTVAVCIEAWRKNHCKHYAISSIQNYSILQIAKLFGGPIKYLPERPGERYSSALTKMNLSNKIINKIGKKNIKKYISDFKKIINGQKNIDSLNLTNIFSYLIILLPIFNFRSIFIRFVYFHSSNCIFFLFKT